MQGVEALNASSNHGMILRHRGGIDKASWVADIAPCKFSRDKQCDGNSDSSLIENMAVSVFSNIAA